MKTFIVFVALCQLAFGLPQLAFQGGHDSSSSDTVPKPPISSSQPKPSANLPIKPLVSSDQGIIRQGAQESHGSSSSGIAPSKPFNGSPVQPSASGSGSFGGSSSGISSSGSSSIGNGRPIVAGSSSGSLGSASEIQETVVRPISGTKQAPGAPASSVSSGSTGSSSGSSGSSSGSSGSSGSSAPKPKPTGADKDDDNDDERERRALSDPVTVKPTKPEVDAPKGVKTPVDRVAATDKPEDDDDIKTDAPRKSFFPSRN